VLRNDKKAIEQIEKYEKEQASLSTTSVNLFELYYGAFNFKHTKENLELIEELTENFEILDFSKKSAFNAGKIMSQLKKSGQPLDIKDIFIAAIAISNNFTLKTNNVKHFEKIEGLGIL
jgi:predicted nucleic acid-binding protein